MALPAGFTLEQPQGIQLPPGFQLETPAPRPMTTGVDAIPGQRSTSQTEAPVSWRDRIMGVVETPAVLAGGIAAGVAAPVAAMYGELTSPAPQGSPEARAAGEALATKARAQFYQPRTQTSQQIMNAIAPVMEAAGAVPSVNALQLTQGAGPAIRAVGDVRAAQMGQYAARNEMLAAPAKAALQAERAAESAANAPRIEAAKRANELGIALNPAVSNPTKSNKVKSVITGTQNLDAKLSEANAPRWGELAKEEMRLPTNTVLDAAAYEKARDNVSGPYRVVEKLPALEPTPEIGATLDKLRQSEELIGGAQTKAAIDALVDDAGNKIAAGMKGNTILTNIRQMRKEAQDIYKAQKAGSALTPEQAALADTKMGIANVLEDLIEANVTDPKALSDLRNARVAMAKTYAYEAATDLNTGKLDPLAIAKITSKNNALTGTIADIGKIAGNFPDVAKVGPAAEAVLPTLTRSSIGGTIGYAAGTLVGAPLAGSIAGAAVGNLVSGVGAKRILNPSYQAAHAVPTDYRPPVNNLRPADINYGPNQLVPYDYSQATSTPPNFVLRPNEYPPKATFVGPEATPRLGMSQGPVGGQIGALRAEDVRVKELHRAQDMQAQAQAEAAAAAARQPTRGAVEMQINPLTGAPEIAAGVKGATPEVFMANTGAALQSAAQKVASGKLFDMTAAEKVAWGKTRADLDTIAPEFAKLNDKAISAKMMDRAWVEDAISKAREKAKMFDEQAKRDIGEQAKRLAAIEREKMYDIADTMEEQLRAARPVKKGGQGPKTLAAKRNALAPETPRIILNNMLPGRE
jgi:hypothetical protein